MPQRGNYWSCCAFGKWVYRVSNMPPKPKAATMEEWSEWRRKGKETHPSIYWFVEEFLDNLQDIVNFPYDKLIDARYYLYNRFIDRKHYLRTGLKPGQWYEFETRILHGLFTELVDYIEVEKAWHQVVCDDVARKQFSPPWWNNYRLFDWGIWRCQEAGLAHLEWEMSLTNDYEWMPDEKERLQQPDYGKPTLQAINASELLELYKWWKEKRPSRPDPGDITGYNDFYESKKGQNIEDFLNMKSKEDKDMLHKLMDEVHKIEEAYEKEDEEMMIRLIKIRQSLWT